MNTARSLRPSLGLTALAIAALFAARPMNTFAQSSPWEPFNLGLYNLLGYTMDADPLDTLTAYAGTDYGNLYKTTNGGFTWERKRQGFPDRIEQELITSVYVDKNDPNYVYAGLGGRTSVKNLYRSSDKGEHWSLILTPDTWSSGGVLRVLATTSTGNRLFVGTGWSRGIWMSSDMGATWNMKVNRLGVQALIAHPLNPKLMYTGSSAKEDIGPLARSTDGGETWQRSITGIANVNDHTGVRSIAVDPRDTNVVWAGVTAPNCLYRSSNGGASWTKVRDFSALSEIVVHPGNSSLLYVAAVDSGVYRTTDAGITWKKLSLGAPNSTIMRVFVAPGYPVRVFMITLKHGIYRLVDEEITEDMIER